MGYERLRLTDGTVLDESHMEHIEDGIANIYTMFINPNLLDNGWFTVNQRRATAISSGYFVDRWMAYHNAGTVTDDGLNITGEGSIYQILDPALANTLVGKTLTASALWVDGTLETATVVYTGSTVAFPGGAFGLNTDGGKLTFSYYGHHAVRALKLEIGDVSTLRNDAMPKYAEELLKCQRYYWCIRTTGNRNSYLFSGICQSATEVRTTIFFPTAMRITPTVTIDMINRLRVGTVSGNTVLLDGATYSTFNILGGDDPGTNPIGIGLMLTKSGAGYTSGTPCYIRNTNAVVIEFDADLL